MNDNGEEIQNEKLFNNESQLKEDNENENDNVNVDNSKMSNKEEQKVAL